MVHYFLFGEVISLICGCGGMADAADSKSAGFTIVWVQVPPSALEKKRKSSDLGQGIFFFSEADGFLKPRIQGLSSASVGAKRMSTGHPAPHHPHASLEFPERMGS